MLANICKYVRRIFLLQLATKSSVISAAFCGSFFYCLSSCLVVYTFNLLFVAFYNKKLLMSTFFRRQNERQSRALSVSNMLWRKHNLVLPLFGSAPHR